MANSINDLLVSDVTLLWPTGEEHHHNSVGGDIETYTWEGGYCPSKAGPRDGGSFLDFLPSLENNDQQRSLSSSVDATSIQEINTVSGAQPSPLPDATGRHSSALWYNYCSTFANLRLDLLSYVQGEEVYRSQSGVPSPLAEDEVEQRLVLPSERPVKGLFIHPDILPGFRYIVRQADSQKPMFDGRALQLTSIGRGYGKRLTFESESRLSNDNYFYCDTHTAGYALRLVALQEKIELTLRDETGTAVAFALITRVHDQVEHSQLIKPNKQVEKKVDVTFSCRLEWFSSKSVSESTVQGSAVLIREKQNTAAHLLKIIVCTLDGEDVRYSLVPGVDETERVSFVSGESIADIPASYFVKGLLPHELPVIGTFVHPNIMVGIKYKVRSLANGKYLFEGRALTLQTIGKGYGKRITFQGESLLHNDNYFYSDTNEEGWGFTVEALSVDDKFRIVSSSNEEVGVAEVFRADLLQHQRVQSEAGEAVVDLTVTCHFFVTGYSDCTTTLSGKASVYKCRTGLKVTVSELKFGWQLSALSGQHLRMERL